MGHPRVSVLDGGLPKWVNEKLPVISTDWDVRIEDFDYKIQKVRIVDKNRLRYHENSNDSHQFIDVRLPELFNEGHIKGAINFPLSKMINLETKILKP